jgi:hypothetical protein
MELMTAATPDAFAGQLTGYSAKRIQGKESGLIFKRRLARVFFMTSRSFTSRLNL